MWVLEQAFCAKRTTSKAQRRGLLADGGGVVDPDGRAELGGDASQALGVKAVGRGLVVMPGRMPAHSPFNQIEICQHNSVLIWISSTVTSRSSRAVMTAGSVTGAAALLHTSQPTLSRDLARLEQLLGYALFERERGRLCSPRPGRGSSLTRSSAASRPGPRGLNALKRWPGTTTASSASCACPRSATRCCRVPWPGCVRPTPACASPSRRRAPLLDAWMSEQRHDLGLTETAAHCPACASSPCCRPTKWPCCPPATRSQPNRGSPSRTLPGRTSSAWRRTTLPPRDRRPLRDRRRATPPGRANPQRRGRVRAGAGRPGLAIVNR